MDFQLAIQRQNLKELDAHPVCRLSNIYVCIPSAHNKSCITSGELSLSPRLGNIQIPRQLPITVALKSDIGGLPEESMISLPQFYGTLLALICFIHVQGVSFK